MKLLLSLFLVATCFTAKAQSDTTKCCERRGGMMPDTSWEAPLKFQISNRPFKPANSIHLTSENKVYVSDSTGNISAERDSSGRWIITNGSQSLETFYLLFLKPKVDSFNTKLKAF